jgi:hypothetical protein
MNLLAYAILALGLHINFITARTGCNCAPLTFSSSAAVGIYPANTNFVSLQVVVHIPFAALIMPLHTRAEYALRWPSLLWRRSGQQDQRWLVSRAWQPRDGRA